MFTSQTETNGTGRRGWGDGTVGSGVGGGVWGWGVPLPARHVNSIFIFLARSISPGIFAAADHTCIFITDL